MSTVGDGLYQYGGVPVPVSFTGKAWFVKPATGSDGNSGRSPVRAFKTLAKALTVGAYGDVVYMIAESNTAASTTDYQSAALDWNVDGLHLIGVNNGSMFSQRSRIAELSSVKTIEDLFTVSADNCLFANLEIIQGVASSTATAARACVVTGTRNRFYNCQISGNMDTGGSTDDAGARSLALSGNATENIFQHCVIGGDTVIRATQIAEVELIGTAGGSKPARNVFENCIINSYTSLTTFKAIKSTYLDRFLLLKDCQLVAAQGITSAVAPTGAILNTTPNGRILLHGTSVFGYADISTLADAGTLVSTYNGLAADLVDMGVAGAATPS